MRSRSMVAERPPGGARHRCMIAGAAAPRVRGAQTIMQAARIAVDVIMEREQLCNRWISERWQARAVEPSSAGAEAIERLPDEPTEEPTEEPPQGPPQGPHAAPHERWRFARLPVDLHPTEAEGYYLNLTSPDPKAFVMWRRVDDGVPPAQPVLVTVSYNEAGRFMDGGEQVDAVPLDASLAAVLRVFVAAHYVPEPRRKNRRNDPFAADAKVEPGRGR